MRLRQPEELEARLNKALDPIYLISGDEPLLQQEAADAVRAAARAAGVDERLVLHVEPGFSWQELQEAASNLSLFGTRRLVELRCSSAAVGQEGARALTAWAERPPEGDLLLVLMPRLEARQTQSKWYRALVEPGVHLPVWPLDLHGFPAWLQQRLRRAGVALDADALAALLERVEGNPLAAAQAVNRLALSERETPWTLTELTAEFDDDARYTAFELAEQMLSGRAEQSHRMLATLRQEGLEPLAIVGPLAWNLRQLAELLRARQQGEDALSRLRLPRPRQALLQRAAQRLSLSLVEGALRDLALVDQAAKGLLALDPWDELDRLVLRLAGVRTTPLALRARTWLEGHP